MQMTATAEKESLKWRECWHLNGQTKRNAFESVFLQNKEKVGSLIMEKRYKLLFATRQLGTFYCENHRVTLKPQVSTCLKVTNEGKYKCQVTSEQQKNKQNTICKVFSRSSFEPQQTGQVIYSGNNIPTVLMRK